jgi:agmatine deiminase
MQAKSFRFPEEWETHKATWLQWPHHFQYGKDYPYRLDPIWMDMVKELSSSEQVNIIVFNQ